MVSEDVTKIIVPGSQHTIDDFDIDEILEHGEESIINYLKERAMLMGLLDK